MLQLLWDRDMVLLLPPKRLKFAFTFFSIIFTLKFRSVILESFCFQKVYPNGGFFDRVRFVVVLDLLKFLKTFKDEIKRYAKCRKMFPNSKRCVFSYFNLKLVIIAD